MKSLPKRRIPLFIQFFRYLTPRVILKLIRRSARYRLNGLSAEIAYHAIFSLFPAILALVSAIALIPWPESQFRNFIAQIATIVPIEAMALVRDFWRALRSGGSQGLFSFSFLISVWVSSSVLGSTMSALDQIHCVLHRYKCPFWKAKLMPSVL